MRALPTFLLLSLAAPSARAGETCASLPLVSGAACVDYSASADVTAFSDCKRITNTHASGMRILVPRNSAQEWALFVAGPPAGVSVANCPPPPRSPVTLFLTSGSLWKVPADWQAQGSSIEVIGGGGASRTAMVGSTSGGGGGGGAYSRIDNVALTPGSNIGFVVGAGGNPAGISGNGGATYLCSSYPCGTTLGAANVIVGAEGGLGAVLYQIMQGKGGAGGAASAGKGTLRYAGGKGGDGGGTSGGGGGGAAGPGGAGGNGVSGIGVLVTNGGAGGGGLGGAGGLNALTGGVSPYYAAAIGPAFMAGKPGTEWSASPAYGSGGGSAGGSNFPANSCDAVAGASYGAGAGGPCRDVAVAASGGPGLIVIRYTPAQAP